MVHLGTKQHRRAIRPKSYRAWNSKRDGIRPSWSISLDSKAEDAYYESLAGEQT